MADYLNMIKIFFFHIVRLLHCALLPWVFYLCQFVGNIESLVHLKQMSLFGQRLPNGISDRISSQLSGILITSGQYLPTFYNPAFML